MEAYCTQSLQTRFLLTYNLSWAKRLLELRLSDECHWREISCLGEDQCCAAPPIPTQGRAQSTPTAITLVSRDLSDIRAPCCYCEQLHSPTDCINVVQVNGHKQLLWHSRRCFSCLRKRHLRWDCHSNNHSWIWRGGITRICGSPTTSGSSNQPAHQLPSHVAMSTPVGETSTTPVF